MRARKLCSASTSTSRAAAGPASTTGLKFGSGSGADQQGRGGQKDSDAAKAYYERAAALGDDDAKKALERMRCPYAIKDKRGNVVTNLCF